MSRVRMGLETLEYDLPAALQGARVGLLAHAASRLPDGRHALAVLQGLNLTVVRLFGPEHGFFGAAQAGETVADTLHGNLPLISLYGARHAPEADHLADLDALVFDVQDVGVRAYTYLATLKACLRRCAEMDVQLLLLDRPNPLGRDAYGAGVTAGSSSFVSAHDVRFVHGMTLGEVGTVVARALGVEHVLRTVRMEGYTGAPWGDLQLPWRAPSPNLSSLASAQLYPLTVFLEGTNISEGRGTGAPFQLLGAPWLRAEALTEVLRGCLVGLEVEPARFTPTASKHAGLEVSGVSLSRIGPFDPLRAAYSLLSAVREQDPARFTWLGGDGFFIDRLAGSDVLRRAVEGDVSEAVFGAWLGTGEGLEVQRVSLYS